MGATAWTFLQLPKLVVVQRRLVAAEESIQVQLSKVVRNAWLPLLIAAVMVVGGFTVARVKSFFGAENAAGVTSARAGRLQAVQAQGRQIRDLRLGAARQR